MTIAVRALPTRLNECTQVSPWPTGTCSASASCTRARHSDCVTKVDEIRSFLRLPASVLRLVDAAWPPHRPYGFVLAVGAPHEAVRTVWGRSGAARYAHTALS